MPIIREYEGVGVLEFPDGTPEEEMSQAADELLTRRDKSKALVPRSQLMPPMVSTTAGGPRATLAPARVGLGSMLQENQMALRPGDEPLPMPQPSQEFIDRNPLWGSFLQRGAQIAGGLGSRNALATLPLFGIPYVGPGLALGLGSKGLSTGAAEIFSGPKEDLYLGTRENIGGGGMESLANIAMLLAGGMQARRPILEATPRGRSLYELIDQLQDVAGGEKPLSIRGAPMEPLPYEQLGIPLGLGNALNNPAIKPIVERALQETTPEGRIIKPGVTRALTELQELAYPEEFQNPPPLVVPGGEATKAVERPEGGAARQGGISFSGEAGGLPSARQQAVSKELGGAEQPLDPIERVREIVLNKDKLALFKLRSHLLKVEPGMGVKGSSTSDYLRLIDARLEELAKGTTDPELVALRNTLGQTAAQPKPLPPMEVKVAPPGQKVITGPSVKPEGGLGVKEAQERAAKQRGETGAIQPEGTERRLTDTQVGLLKRFQEAATEVAKRINYGVRKELSKGKTFVVSWDNGSRSWGVTMPSRTDVPNWDDPAAVRAFREKYPKGRPRFLKKNEEVRLDANQVLVQADTMREAELIAQHLPTLPLDKFSAENNPLLRRGPMTKERAQEYFELMGQEPDSVDVMDSTLRFMDKIRSPEQVVEGQPGIKIPPPKGTGEQGSFMLPGPELIRTLSGFKRTATVAGQQLYNRVKNLITPDEMKAYDDAGFKAFMSRPRSPDDVAKWMEEHGPKVETKVFEGGAQGRDAQKEAMLAHQLDTINPNWRQLGVEDIEKDWTKEQKKVFYDWQDAEANAKALDYPGLDPDKWRDVSSSGTSPQKMVVVRVPLKGSELAKEASMIVGQPNNLGLQDARREAGLLYRGGHLGSEDINVLGWTRGHDEVVGGKKATVLDEVQSDWGQRQRELEAEFKRNPQAEAASRTSQQQKMPGHVLLRDWPRLTLKAQIEQSLKEGKEAIVVPDDKTAMLSEGHDLALVPVKGTYTIPELAGKKVHTTQSGLSTTLLELNGKVDIVDGIGHSQYKLHTKDGHTLTMNDLWSDSREAVNPAIMNQIPHRPRTEQGMRQNYDPLYSILDRHGNVIAKETFADAESAHAFAQNRTAGLGLREGQYDVSRGILHDIMEELTGVKGEPVDLGPHQNAMAKYGSEDWRAHLQGRTMEEMREEFKETGGVPRSDLVLRNPDGTLKVNATGRLYDLSKVAQRTEPFRMFGSDKLSEAKTAEAPPGIKIKLGERGESGAIVLPPILKKIVDAMTPKKGATLTDAEVEYGTKGPVIMFRSYDTEKKIATSPQGIGKIPGLGQVFDPRSKAKTPVMQAILAGQQMTFKGKQIATLFLEATKTSPRAFLEDDAGNATLASGHKAPTSDIIRREIANPGSQPLTADQRQFVIMWRALRKGLVDYARSEGVTKVLDDQGSTVNLSKWSFPTSSYFDEVSGTIKREKDAYVRVSKFMEAIYSAIAAQRMSRDPALRGRPVSSGPMRLDEGGSFVPWARGRIFPKAVADQINHYYGAQPHSFARNLTDVNDVLKAVKFTLDVSAPFNQGLIMMARHPIRWAHAAARSYAAIADPNQFSKYLQPRMQDAIEFVTHGGSLGSLQDFLIGARAEGPLSRIPVVKDILHPAIKRSAESMNTFLSIGKLEMYRALKQSVPVKDLPKLVEAVENLMLSGRMEAIGLTPARNLAERLLFNAPSYLRGAANIVASLPQGGLQGKLALKALGTLAGSLSITMLGLYKMDGMSNEEIKERFDPGNSKFLKYPLKLGNGDVIEVGPGNAILQMARLVGNVYDVVMDKKPSGSGVEGNPFIRWMSYRSSPLVQLGIQVYTGKDYLWRDISATEAAGRALLPISIEQFFSSEKLGTRAAESGFSLLGLQSYPENFTATRNRLQNETAETLFKKPYDQLLPYERAQVTEEIKPQMEQKRKETGPPSLAFIEKMDKARKERMTESLQPEQQTFLQQHGLSLPGYRLQDTVRGTDVFFTKEEEVRYEKYLVEEYKVAIDRLRESEDFADVPQKAKEVRFDRLTTMARERARRRLQLEIRGDQ